MKNKNNEIFITLIIVFIIIVSILLIINILSPKEGELISLNYKEIQEKVSKKESFILVVSQSTCSHCALYKPKLKLIAKDYKINIYYIDYDKEKETTQKEFLKSYNLDGSTPITLFIKNGKQESITQRLEGDVSKEKAIEKFKKMGFIK